MNNEKIMLASKAVELSESKTFIELTNRLCYYDFPNLNGVQLPSDTAEEKAKTLIDMPVVAKYKRNIKGQDDLGSHEVTVDRNGNVKFGTENIGVHTSVEIKDDEVEINGEKKVLPCLFAKSKIWTRNKNVISAIKRLFSEGKLFSSWEILSSSFTFENGVKTLTDYVFESNCLLGENVSPAYGSTSCALGLASVQESELLIAEALANDIDITTKEQEDKDLNKETIDKVDDVAVIEVVEEISQVETTETIETEIEDEQKIDISNSTKTEVSALTEWDLRRKIQEACKDKISCWCWVAFHFPVDKVVWVEKDCRESELDYILFTYDVDSEDNVTVSDGQEIKLTVSISEVNKSISQKDEALLKANEKIQELTSEVEKLQPFKEAYEKVEAERIEKETAQKKADLLVKLENSKLFTKEELESSNVKEMIENVDEIAVKGLIADKFIATLESKTDEMVETSEVSTNKNCTANLNVDTEDEIDYKSAMKQFLKKK